MWWEDIRTKPSGTMRARISFMMLWMYWDFSRASPSNLENKKCQNQVLFDFSRDTADVLTMAVGHQRL